MPGIDRLAHYRQFWNSKSEALPDFKDVSQEEYDLYYVYVIPKLNADHYPDEIIQWARKNVPIWSKLYRDHFKPPPGKIDPGIRRRLESNGPQEHAWEAEEDPIHWHRLPIARESFVTCFLLMDTFTNQADFVCLLPPMIQLSEDYQVPAKMNGLQCVIHSLRIAPDLVVRMGLGDLCYELFKVNMTFHEETILLQRTIEALGLLCRSGWKDQSSTAYLDALDEFLDILLKDLTLCRDENRLTVLLSSLNVLVKLEGLGSIRYLPEFMEIFLDVSGTAVEMESRKACRDVFDSVCIECKPLIHRHKEKWHIIQSRLE
jgi:hypothetical protein